MEQSGSVLESTLDDETLDEDQDLGDVEMFDAETLDNTPSPKPPLDCDAKDDEAREQEPRSKNRRRRNSNKKRNKKRGSASNVTDINRFVLETCRQLKEKKSYLVWNAVGVLGPSAVNDLVKEVDAIQGRGGQMTVDGKRFRTSGGILWNILKTREPKAYKEIMARGKEFEKQFRRLNVKQDRQGSEATTQISTPTADGIVSQVPEHSQITLEERVIPAHCNPREERVPAFSRIRAPVTYDDLFENDKGGLTEHM